MKNICQEAPFMLSYVNIPKLICLFHFFMYLELMYIYSETCLISYLFQTFTCYKGYQFNKPLQLIHTQLPINSNKIIPVQNIGGHFHFDGGW